MKLIFAKTILCAGVSLLPFAAFAQEQEAVASTQPSRSGGIQEIVVTAQKRAENMQDVPISVSALSSEQLEQRGISDLSDVLASPPPGVTLQPFAGSQTLLIIDLRGVTNADPGQGTTELGTAVYLDDVYLGRGQGLGLELADPERIEILRGPQGTLFGRNAEGGAVRVVTRKPTGEFGLRAKGMLGNYDNQRFEAHLDLPEIAGFSIKLDYLNSNHDGYISSGPKQARLDEQRDFGAYEAEGYRASVRWQPLDGLTVDYAYDHSEISDARDYNIIAQPNQKFKPNGPLNPLNTFMGARDLDQINKRPGESWIPLYNGGFDTEVSGHTLQVEYEASDDITLRSISAFRKTREMGSGQLGGAFTLASLGPSGLPISFLVPGLGSTSLGLPMDTQVYGISGVNAYNDVDQNQFSQEFQLVGSTDEFEYVFGLYYFEEDVSDTRQAFLSIVYTDPEFTNAIGVNPFTVGSPGSGLSVQQVASRSYAAFSQVTYSPNFADNRLHITGGLRYTDDKKTFLRTVFGGAPVDITGRPFSEKRFDPAFTVAYDLAEDVNIYARYAQAYRSGGVSVRSPSFDPFGSEVNKAFELGLKSQFLDRRLQVNAALFQNNIYNRQITSQLDPTGDPSITDTLNAPGNTKITGGELEIIAVPTDGLQFSVSYTYLDGKRPPSYETLDPNAEIRIQSLPKHAITAAVDYFGPEMSWGQFAVHFDYATASKTPGTGRVAYGAYAFDIDRDVANGRIALRKIPVGPVELTVAVFGKNLFDTAYPVFTAPGANAILSPPRTYGIELGIDF